MNKNQIARNVALRLFTNGNGESCHRLMLVSEDGRNLGGWGISPLMDVVANEIEQARKRERKAKRRKASSKRRASK